MSNRKAIISITEEATKSGNEKNHAALGTVRARVIGGPKDGATKVDVTKAAEAGKSTVLPEDPFRLLADNGRIIEPPFDLLTLSMLIEHSSELNQCIEAMETNIEGFGHRYLPRIKDKHDEKVPEPIAKVVKKERVWLENFFAYCTRESFVEFR